MALYTETVMDHFMHPRNVGSIENADGVGEVGNAKCGDIMKIYLKIDDNRVTDVKFETFGCGSAIASSSMATEMIKGKAVEEALALTNKEVVDALNSGEDIIPTDTVTNRTGVTYYPDPQFADVFADMDGKLITYRIETARKITPLRRLMQFCRAIKDDMIDINIHHDMQKSIVQLMADEIESIKNAGEYDALAQAITGFNLKSLTFDYGDNAYRVDEADHMIVTEFDIDRYFKVAGKKLGDGLDYAYWIFKHNQGLDDKDAKIEVVVLAGHNDAMQRINDWCEDKFAELYNKYRAKIGKLNDARRMEYERLSDATDRPQDIDWHLPSSVGFTVGEDSRAYDKHIYIAVCF